MVVERSSCALCTLRRRRCDDECLFRPHFPRDGEKGKEKEKQASNVLKVFGCNRVNKALKSLNSQYHTDYITSITFSADARVRDPVGGCARIIDILDGNIAFYSDQLSHVANMLSDIKRAQSSSQASLDDDDNDNNDSLPALLQLLQPYDPFPEPLSDQIPNGEVNKEIEIGQAQPTVDPPPYRVGDNQAQGQAQAPQVLIDFLPVPQLDLSGQIPYDGVDNQINIGLEPTPNDVDDQIAIGLEPTSYNGVDDQIEIEPEPKRRRFI